MRGVLALVLLLIATMARAATYYVDPATGNNANNGTSSATPWLNPPGTRTAAGGGYWGTGAWGAITTGNKLACNDTILLKGGATQTSTQGGQWYIVTGGYYPTSCTLANPIRLRVATAGEWAGSSGPFTLNLNGVTLTNSPAYNMAGGIQVSGVRGISLLGLGNAQRLRISNATTSAGNPAGVEIDSGINGTTVQMDTVLQWFEVLNGNLGVTMGEVQNALVDQGIIHDMTSHGIMCGNFGHHECDKVGWTNIEVYNTGTNVGQGFGCDAMYVQGPRSLKLLNIYSHNNQCNGYNNGAGDHVYPWRSRTIIRNSVFARNGLSDAAANAGANTEGGGDTFPSEVLQPTQGYTSTGGICAAGTGGCSVYDAYSAFQRVVSFGGMKKGPYAHHGSGFTWWWNNTIVGNGFSTSWGTGAIVTDRVAGDHQLANSIVVQKAGYPGLTYNTNGLPAVCRQGTPNQGQPCSSDAQCGGAATSTSACGQYLPMMDVKYTLWRPSLPSGTNAETMSYLTFRCDASCTGGTANQQCASDSECSGCVGGCNMDTNTGATFSGALANGARFLTHATNKIGASFNPNFVSTPATCLDGTDITSCDLHLTSGSVAIDAGTFQMLTSAAGSNTTVVPVKGNLPSRGLNFNGNNDDPTTFFIPKDDFPTYPGDTIQIQNATCAAGSPTLAAGRAIVLAVSRSPAQITIDRACTWTAANLGVDLPWEGAAPDLGAFEFNGFGPPSTTSTSTIPVPTTTSTSSTTVTTLPGTATSIFSAQIPVSTGPPVDPAGPVELGVKFGSAVPGNITAIRFYKAAGNTGTHVGNLWDNAGNRLTTVTFANETAGGWQEQALPVPIHINANTTYVVSYFAPIGAWSYTQDFLATRFTNSPLYALGQNESPNGVYSYGVTSSFPTTNWSGTHYFADVVFAADTNPPTTTVTSLPGTTVTSTTAVTTSTVVTTTTTSTSTTTLPGPFKGSGIGGGSIN